MIRWMVQEIYQEVGESWVDIIMDDFHSEAAACQFAYDFRKDHPEIDEWNLKIVIYRVMPE